MKSKRAAHNPLQVGATRGACTTLATNLEAARRFKSALPIARNSGSEGNACGRRCLSQVTASAISCGCELCPIVYLSDMMLKHAAAAEKIYARSRRKRSGQAEVLFQKVVAHLSERQRQQGVHGAVRLPDGDTLRSGRQVGWGGTDVSNFGLNIHAGFQFISIKRVIFLAWKAPAGGHPRRHDEQACEAVLRLQPGEQRNGSPLAESSDNDAIGRYSGLDLSANDVVDERFALSEAFRIKV
jgi:hypothetical protein